MFSKYRILIALQLCLIILVFGCVGYMTIEDYTLIESVYMSIITITTVGFGEVKPLSDAGRGFTVLLIIVGFGGMAFAGRSIVESLLEKNWSADSREKKMKKRISQLKSHYIICGYGRVGIAAAEHFHNVGSDFVIIEAGTEHCRQIKEKDYFLIEGDATHENILLEAGIKSARGLLALLASDPDNLFIVLTARELNPTLHIISRSEETSSDKKIFRAGADSVVSPFATAGIQIARDIIDATEGSAEFNKVDLKRNFTPQWITVLEGSSMIKETISNVSGQMGREIIGLRRNDNDFIFPDGKIKVEIADILLVIDERHGNGNKEGQPAKERKKLVIVDDNPVILKLYARLFQKAGFHIFTAIDGGEALDLIIHEKPAAAVIDYMLPVISGIEVCSKVRSTKEGEAVKLILFTADNRSDTRKKAFDAGADAVVVKSPETAEIIDTVIRILN